MSKIPKRRRTLLNKQSNDLILVWYIENKHVDHYYHYLKTTKIKNRNDENSWSLQTIHETCRVYLMYKFMESEGVCSLEGLVALVALMRSEQHPPLLLLFTKSTLDGLRVALGCALSLINKTTW